jgi:hypothetical protein
MVGVQIRDVAAPFQILPSRVPSQLTRVSSDLKISLSQVASPTWMSCCPDTLTLARSFSSTFTSRSQLLYTISSGLDALSGCLGCLLLPFFIASFSLGVYCLRRVPSRTALIHRLISLPPSCYPVHILPLTLFYKQFFFE